MILLHVLPSAQQLFVIENKQATKCYKISTAKNGLGTLQGSYKTPTGWHVVRAKIGQDMPINTIFVGRRPTGQYDDLLMQKERNNQDWILTRILWLSGLELGKNRLGNCDTMRRYIYIHGTPYEDLIGKPTSKGCVRMKNRDIIELFDIALIGTRIYIGESIPD